jgi:hypothetical protein
MNFVTFSGFGAAAALVATLGAGPAAAQLNVSSTPISIAPSGPTDVAYDPVHDAYLYVGNISPMSSPPATGGAFINAATRVASSPFLIHANANGALGISAVYSPDVSDGAGGFGGFVVMWFEQLVAGFNGPLQTQVVAYPGRLVGPRQTIVSSANQIWKVSGAYSPVNRVFLFTWGDWSNSVTQSVRLDLNAQPLGPITPIAAPSSTGCDEFIYDCMDVTTVWNAATNEFGVAYHDNNTVTVARIAGNGSVVQRTVVVNQNARRTMDVNLASGNYIAAWANAGRLFDNSMNIAEVSGHGGVLHTAMVSGVASNTFGIAVSYSPASRTFLLAGDPGGATATELDYSGSQIGPAVATGFSFLPRIASRLNAPEWAIANGGSVRIATTASLRCGTADPFAALGGGTCFNGGWYPSSTPAPPPPPLPLPPPPSPSGCLTPDPFVAFGGGSCFNGGWYPPGANVAPPPPPPPPLPPPGPGGCLTPDPFVAFGGGVCFNGGWYFRS